MGKKEQGLAVQDAEAVALPPAQTLEDARARKVAVASVGEKPTQGLALNTFAEMALFAEMVETSKLAPDGLKTKEQIFVALQLGAELGLTPMSAMQNIAVINNRPSIWGDAMLAICKKSTLFDHATYTEKVDGLGDKAVARCTVRRLPNGNPVTQTFSMEDAKQANLLNKDPWKKYPRRMLQMRARSFALRDCFPDLLKGLLSREEIIDVEGDVIPVPDTPIAEPKAIASEQPSDTSQTEEEKETKESSGTSEATEDAPEFNAQDWDHLDHNIVEKTDDEGVFWLLRSEAQGWINCDNEDTVKQIRDFANAGKNDFQFTTKVCEDGSKTLLGFDSPHLGF